MTFTVLYALGEGLFLSLLKRYTVSLKGPPSPSPFPFSFIFQGRHLKPFLLSIPMQKLFRSSSLLPSAQRTIPKLSLKFLRGTHEGMKGNCAMVRRRRRRSFSPDIKAKQEGILSPSLSLSLLAIKFGCVRRKRKGKSYPTHTNLQSPFRKSGHVVAAEDKYLH